jgi:hypothetical protein
VKISFKIRARASKIDQVGKYLLCKPDNLCLIPGFYGVRREPTPTRDLNQFLKAILGPQVCLRVQHFSSFHPTGKLIRHPKVLKGGSLRFRN